MEGKDVDDIRSFFIRNFYKLNYKDEEEREHYVDKYFRRQRNWGKIKNRYGLLVQTIALIAMFGLIWYTVVNVNLLAEHPCNLCEDLGYVCHTPVFYKCYEIKNCSDYQSPGACEEDYRTCKVGVMAVCQTLIDVEGELFMKDSCGCYWNETNKSCGYNYILKKTGRELG